MQEIDFDEIAHEIWATAQLRPNEGIEDGVERVFNLLITNFKKPPHSIIEDGCTCNKPNPIHTEKLVNPTNGLYQCPKCKSMSTDKECEWCGPF